METNTTTLADYLFTRLRQLGVDSIFGLPGDYNLNLLDYVEPAKLHWIGNCNELNAGYAADGYARIKGLGALVTTFGVGELSAINAIAGAYAERAPVVHVVGTPIRDSQDSRSLIHHTFNDGEYQRFDRMYEHVTVAQTMISDLRSAPGEIDRVLLQCLVHSRPVRIAIPDDMVALRVPTRNLDSKISIPLPARQPKVEEEALAVILERIYNAKRPMILIDGESRQSQILDEVDHLVRSTEWPTFTTGFGKSLIDETLPNVYGVFIPAHKPFVDSCDLVLHFGPHPSNTNTYIFQTIPPAATTVAFAATTVKIDKQTFRDLPAKLFLPQLIAQLDSAKIPAYKPDLPHPTTTLAAPSALTPTEKVNNASFWKKLTPFFREGDIILAETGTAGYGANEFILPPRTRLFKPVTWLSIGYMLPAALGASLAQRDRAAHGSEPGRTVLLIGDGSFQLTAQELATIIHHKLDVVVFLINNAGYTIERCIHGHDARYNDITPWRYLKALELFGAPTEGEYAGHAWTVRTWADLEGVLSDERMAKGKGVRMVEVCMEMLDAPKVLLNLLEKQFPEKSGA
ncbi:pyruvate decarboxylase [Aspergillus taichungensis]|uniref:Pyruvate decarboxylase n=1 Tax=Aspergillus taichungensis TaxID=482145 RepID=A0A2J5HDS9_9EURO|nr:pyruvate decarboxylase [Aspergillus taichungensis]